MDMELWFTEYQASSFGITIKASKTLFRAKSDYQDIAVIETEQFGKVLLLDGIIQTTEADEFFYHEMITHVPLSVHGTPKSVLVVGGGDGGTVREVLKHNSVERVVLAEIDEMVINVAREYFPSISSGLSDKRVEIRLTDGIRYVKENPGAFDAILVDSTDPVGPAKGLFEEDFYRSVFECLTDGGVFAAQTESPFFNIGFVKRIYATVGRIFPGVHLYSCPVPTYIGGYWCFTLGEKKPNVANKTRNVPYISGTRYWTPQIHEASFAMPAFVREAIK
jgi:spermidine synthase